jgi:hypothetical protein
MEMRFVQSIVDRKDGLVDEFFDLYFDDDTLKVFVVGVEIEFNPYNMEPYHLTFKELQETPEMNLKREDRLRKYSHWEKHLAEKKKKQEQQQQQQ